MNFFDMDSGCHFGPWFLRAVANSVFCRLRRQEGRMQRGHLALRQRAVALCTPTSTRRLPDLATALHGSWFIIACTALPVLN